MPGIFISYRREDAPGHAGRIFDRLRARFGSGSVFMDVSAIEAGADFVAALERAIGSCDVLLAVIGPGWAQATDRSGRKRLDNPRDFIRLEIAGALKRNIRVIPLLVEDAEVPSPDDLPEDLRALTRRHAVELRDSRWDADIDELVATLEKTATASAAAGDPKGGPSPQRRARRIGLWAAAAVAIAAVAGSAIWALGPRLVEPERSAFDLAPDARSPSASLAQSPTPSTVPPSLPPSNGPEAERRPPDPAPRSGPAAESPRQQDPARGARPGGSSGGASQNAGPGWIGVRLDRMSENPPGALVGDVSSGGPASLAGIHSGDVINEFAGRSISTLTDLTRSVLGSAPGVQVSIVVVRNGRSLRLPLTIGTPPPRPAIPDVTGQSLRDAARRLQEAGIDVAETTYVEDREKAPDLVVGQRETAGRAPERLAVSLSVVATATLLVGVPTDDAATGGRFAEFLRSTRPAAGLVVRSQSSTRRSGYAGGVSYSDADLQGRAAAIAKDAGKWLSDAYTRPIAMEAVHQPRLTPRTIQINLPSASSSASGAVSGVPDVTGQPFADASRRLKDAGVELSQVTYAMDASRSPDVVLSQSVGRPRSPGARAVALTVAARARVAVNHVADDAAIAAKLVSFLKSRRIVSGLEVRANQVSAESMAARPQFTGRVSYRDADLETSAAAIAKDAAKWLSDAYSRPVALDPSAQPSLGPRTILIVLPSR
jgi:hypothetical protein